MRKTTHLYSFIATALLLAIGLVLPFLTGQLQSLAQAISPLHIPVLICGLCCGWKWGLALGIVLPLLRSLLFGIPPFPTTALPMVFELSVYGVVTGALYPLLVKRLKLKTHLPAILIALVAAMLLGRLAGGAAKAIFITAGVIGVKEPYTFAVFFASYFAGTLPGMAIHIVLIPAVVMALEKAKLSPLAQSWRQG